MSILARVHLINIQTFASAKSIIIGKFLCIFFFVSVSGDNFSGCSNFSARLSLQPKLSRASLISDEAPTEYRRKSAGSPNATVYNTQGFSTVTNTAEPYIYAFDECERHPDGTVVLR